MLQCIGVIARYCVTLIQNISPVRVSKRVQGGNRSCQTLPDCALLTPSQEQIHTPGSNPRRARD